MSWAALDALVSPPHIDVMLGRSQLGHFLLSDLTVWQATLMASPEYAAAFIIHVQVRASARGCSHLLATSF